MRETQHSCAKMFDFAQKLYFCANYCYVAQKSLTLRKIERFAQNIVILRNQLLLRKFTCV